ncbi:protein FLX-like 1 [Vicia villosa]|uniref:protein FLX-like 1 n=1 Tax=Vicia villosa TaxID=3911 RepID=UPI00273BFFD3|nr:protein FLX-like 1 [Vicia villosa]
MSGRNHHHHLHSSLPRRDEPRLSHSLPVAALEDRINARHRELHSLLLENQRLAATHLALKQDLSATQLELRQLSVAAADVKAERDAEVRRIYEKSLKMDAEVRAVAAMKSDLDQVRSDVREFVAERKELASQLQAIQSELDSAREDSKSLPAIKGDIEALRHEIQRGRNAIEFEKKTHANNLEQKRVMDNNMIIMTREVEKLRAELANAEKRARAAIVAAANPSPVYHANNADMGFVGITYPPDTYSMHQIHAGIEGHPQYAYGATLHHP